MAKLSIREKNDSYLAEVVIAVLLIVFSSVILVQIVATDVIFWREGRGPGPAFLAAFLGAALFIVGMLNLIKAVRIPRARRDDPARDVAEPIANTSGVKLWATVGIVLLAPVLMAVIGALPTIAVTVVALQRLVESMKLWASLLAGIAIAAACYLLFEQVLGLRLPTGLW